MISSGFAAAAEKGPADARRLINLTSELPDMLAAREHRVFRQKELIREYHAPLISFTLNIPGPVKVPPLVPEAFFFGISRIRTALTEQHIPILNETLILEKTGLEAMFSADASSEALKEAAVSLEDGSRLGRLFDIDVIRTDGLKVSREDLGLPPRKCLLCGEPAGACARSRRHSVKELTDEIQNILNSRVAGW